MTFQFIFAFILLYSLLFFIGIEENVFADSEAAFLKVILIVNNTGGGTAQPADFSIYVDGAAEPSYFPGSTKGKIVLVGPGTHQVYMTSTIVNEVPYALDFSGNCVSKGLKEGEVAIKPGDRKTCIINASYPNFD